MSVAEVVIIGAGLFRDLCEQGVDCLLVDKGDSGASAAPSRLIHGGLKYLETGELRLVAQSTLERNLSLANAPYCVAPLETMVPVFSWFKGVPAALRTRMGSTTAPRGRGALRIKIGLAVYNHYASRHRASPAATIRCRSSKPPPAAGFPSSRWSGANGRRFAALRRRRRARLPAHAASPRAMDRFGRRADRSEHRATRRAAVALRHDRALTGSMTRGEIDRIARHEQVIRLADVVLRRTTLAISGALTLANLVGLAKVCAQALGWTKERRDAEVAVTLVRINRVRLA